MLGETGWTRRCLHRPSVYTREGTTGNHDKLGCDSVALQWLFELILGKRPRMRVPFLGCLPLGHLLAVHSSRSL
jgi:hypothetical protein